MKAACSTILFLLLFIFNANAQTATLKGKVIDKNGATVPSATVSILKAVDSSWLRSEIAGDDGSFTIGGIPVGSYLLDMNAIGFEHTKQPVILKAGLNEDLVVTMQKASTSLKEVTVTGKKSFIENGLGKTIVNVEGSGIAVGSNILELLRKLPGVTVDANNNISMAGKQGVLVLINGKETYLSADQLADYLKSMSANELSQIELITQPSAKYDASGNAGIINIKMKKSRKEGFNGSADLEYGQGVYPAEYAALRANYHKDKLNLYADGTYFNAIGWARITRDRTFFDPQSGAASGYDNSVQVSKEYFSNDKLQLGADYDIDSQTTVGLSATDVYHPNHESTYTSADIADNTSGNIVHNDALTLDTFLRTNAIANAYLKHEFGKDHTLDINLDFINYNQHTKQNTTNSNYASQGAAPPGLDLRGDMPFNMNIYSAKADYARMVGKVKLETGLKSSLVAINNTADYTVLENNSWLPDTTRSNSFLYNENVNSAYVNVSKELGKKWQAQAGLRAEQVNLRGKQAVGSKEFSKNYLSLFPTAFVSYKANDDNQLELNYGRRIDRPNYKRLNPFVSFINQYSYSVGNPELRPQFSHNMELKHSYKNQLVTSLSCSYSKDIIGTIVIPDAHTKGTVRTDRNIGIQQAVNASISYNKQLYKWFLMAIACDGYYAEYAGKLLDEEIRSEGGGCFVTVDTQFVFGKWQVDLYYHGSTGYRDDLLVTTKPQHDLDAYVSRKLFKDTCLVKLHVRDPLGLNRDTEHAVFDNTIGDTDYRFHSRQVALSVSYSFGKNSAKAKHESQLDEMKRLN